MEKIRLSDLQAKNRGFGCPKCGCKDFRDEQGRPFKTIKTEPLPGQIRRYKECRNCGYIIRTKEIIDKKK